MPLTQRLEATGGDLPWTVPVFRKPFFGRRVAHILLNVACALVWLILLKL